MNQPREQQQSARPGQQPIKQAGHDADAQADALLGRAQEVQAEQTALLEATPCLLYTSRCV